jgi:hypothetical protein
MFVPLSSLQEELALFFVLCWYCHEELQFEDEHKPTSVKTK